MRQRVRKSPLSENPEVKGEVKLLELPQDPGSLLDQSLAAATSEIMMLYLEMRIRKSRNLAVDAHRPW